LKDAREELDDKAKDLDKKITYFRDTIIGDIKGSMSSSIKDQISILLDD